MTNKGGSVHSTKLIPSISPTASLASLSATWFGTLRL
ncbi:hypothetical protein RDI58_004200 [Solanum bulbocastanum]|uniref:Uncharacterized protein n=1 Tax=Solanum bulbocastanum TaxID=147425 RepID=A0AAN8U0W1_SOLBU